MKTKNWMALAVIVLASASASAAYAATSTETLYDNLNEATQGADLYSDNQFGPVAASFSTGSAAATLGTVSVLFQENFADPPGDSATVSLVADDNTAPGAVIATLGTVDDGQLSFTPTLFSFSGGEQLAADTRYWIEVVGTTSSVGAWNSDGTDAGTGVAGEYVSNFNGVSSNSNGAYQMEVTAEAAAVSAAPEPSTWLLMMAGVGAAGLLLRRAKTSLGSRVKGALAVVS